MWVRAPPAAPFLKLMGAVWTPRGVSSPTAWVRLPPPPLAPSFCRSHSPSGAVGLRTVDGLQPPLSDSAFFRPTTYVAYSVESIHKATREAGTSRGLDHGVVASMTTQTARCSIVADLSDILASCEVSAFMPCQAVMSGRLGSEWAAAAVQAPSRSPSWPTARTEIRSVGRILRAPGAIAQLGERLLCKQEVAGSIPAGSMKPDPMRTGLWFALSLVGSTELVCAQTTGAPTR
jgi:hypothetical protein